MNTVEYLACKSAARQLMEQTAGDAALDAVLAANEALAGLHNLDAAYWDNCKTLLCALARANTVENMEDFRAAIRAGREAAAMKATGA